MDLTLTQGPDVIRAHLHDFMQFEFTLIGQVHDHLASAMPTRYVPVPIEKQGLGPFS